MNQVPSGPVVRPPDVIHQTVADDSTYPNNPDLPVLVYRHALELPDRYPATAFEQVFGSHGWSGSWRGSAPPTPSTWMAEDRARS